MTSPAPITAPRDCTGLFSMKLSLCVVFLVAALLRPAAPEPVEDYPFDAAELLRVANEEVTTKLPGFPKSYEVEYTFYLPYTDVFSSSPVKYPVHMWVDAEDEENVKLRVEDNGGLNKKITTKEIEYTVNPRIDEVMCQRGPPPKDPHGRAVLKSDRGLPHDMGNWTHLGAGVYDGEPCEVYQLKETFYERTAYYTLYVSMTGVPLYLSAVGQNYFTGAHFDEYLAYFTNYVPGVPDQSVFEAPPECEGKWWYESASHRGERGRPLTLQLDFLIPRIVQGHPEYDEFVMQHGRLHSSPLDYERRVEIFLRNKEHVEKHNMRNDVTYTLELNHFADMTDEEFLAFKTGHLEESDEVDAWLDAHAMHFVDNKNEEPPPASFSWFGTPADGIVKDQAICGSCWAFAATEAMQGAWYVATNESLSFSEQQLVDCAWDFFNNACEGGFVSTAILYAVYNDGLASEMAYPYVGYDDYCKHDVKNVAKFSNVGIAGRFEPAAVRKALAEYGPLGVSMDAGHLDFRFYKSGVFYQPECKSNRTNHAVTLIGYDKDENGKNYWFLKNSWGKIWGDKGYFKMDADEFDCGVTYRPVFAVPDEEAVKKRQEELHSHGP